MKKVIAVLLAAGAVAVAAVPAGAKTSASPYSAYSLNIAQLAGRSPQLTTLVKLVKSAGLVKALEGNKKLTVFAPTNAAFAKLPKATLKKLEHNKKLLIKVLEYHVVSGAYLTAKLDKLHSLKTLEGAKLTVKVKHKSLYINNAKVTTANVLASNGVIDVINAVLIPPTK